MRISGEQLSEVAIEPRGAVLVSQRACRDLGEATPERELHVVGNAGLPVGPGELVGVGGGEPIDEPRSIAPDVASHFALGETEHLDADEAARAGPGRLCELGAHAAGEDEAPRTVVVVDRPLHRAEHLGNLLPLVEHERFTAPAECGVGVEAERGRLGGHVEAGDVVGVAERRRGLPDRSGPGERDRGEFAEQLREASVDESRLVGGGFSEVRHGGYLLRAAQSTRFARS